MGCGSKPCKFMHDFKDILLAGCKGQLKQLHAALTARANATPTADAHNNDDTEEHNEPDERAAALLPSVEKALNSFRERHPEVEDS